jgi:hypothetical protein
MKQFAMFMILAAMAAAGQPAGVPKPATEVEPNTWRHVDAGGKAWLYRQSPFGLMRSEEPAGAATGGRIPDGVPKDAVELEAGRYRWKDEKGQAWIYQSSATGMMKTREVEGEDAKQGPLGAKIAAAGSDALHLVSVKEEGDSLRFTKPGPFGKYSWVKKKTQLDDDEKKVWEMHLSAAKSKTKAGK